MAVANGVDVESPRGKGVECLRHRALRVSSFANHPILSELL
ncbi:hypothetical protein N136_03172 [Leifsonia aquatica ATCC 14665]|uniref:Uncharacterized protein n=1 Tax=Leifsonia aquatica ATCC 14665 TaxID=1358026 RepID=U2RPK0_LEIAQ|nr:hypothetical protein N136_03172 [Leifsonia aquatica ATCC 14665]